MSGFPTVNVQNTVLLTAMLPAACDKLHCLRSLTTGGRGVLMWQQFRARHSIQFFFHLGETGWFCVLGSAFTPSTRKRRIRPSMLEPFTAHWNGQMHNMLSDFRSSEAVIIDSMVKL